MVRKADLETLVDELIQKIGFKVSDNNFTKNLIHYLNTKHELGSNNLNGGISLVSKEMFLATQNREKKNEDFRKYYAAIKSVLTKSWNDVTYDELGTSYNMAIIASMLNIQVAFDENKLLPGMAYDEQCTFYLKLIENEQFFGQAEEDNCLTNWPTTGISAKDFYDDTSSMKIFVIPLPVLSEENSFFGIKIKLDPAEGTWVGIGEDCKYSTAYRKANREIMVTYRLEDDGGNFQQPTHKQKMNICLRTFWDSEFNANWDAELPFTTLNLSGYDLLPEEPGWEDDGPQFKSFKPRPRQPISDGEASNIKESYEAVKSDLMIEDAIKINSKYEISDWGSLENNTEKKFGENRGLTTMGTWSLIALAGFIVIVLLIVCIYRCCKKSENDPMNLPSGTRDSYAAGNTKSPETNPQDTLPPPPEGWMRRSIRNLSKIVQKTPPTQRKLPAGYNMSDFA